MKNISKREKIILAVVGVVLLYGLFDIFILQGGTHNPPTAGPVNVEQQLRETDELVVSATSALNESELATVDVYIIERAERAWPRDPFFVGMPTERIETAEGDKALRVTFTYSGFIEMGAAQMAIINGVDYQVGEDLEIPGYVLRSISPQQVVIEHKELRQRVTVPFREDY
ncbi:MAG: hypothetical protein AVO39_01770 [delta proteobacterium MLS_D]|nr:MAG: hypothetical protein AVO39_01770 [delta proteobacterium MLS_D]